MNAKLMRGVLGVSLLLLLCLVVFTEEDTVTPVQPKGIELSYCNNDDAFGGNAKDPELQQAVIQRWMDRTGYTIKPIIIPMANYKDKVSVMMASGDVPDVIRAQQAMNFVPMYAAREIILPLDTYIANNPILSQVDKKFFEFIPIKGKTYYIPYYRPMNKFLWIRNDMRNRFGIKLSATPTTEEFFNEMKKAVGSGVIPFTFPKFVDNFQFFYNSFGVYVNAFGRDKSGKIIDGFQTNAAKETLTYIKKLYDAGIMNKEWPTTENAKMREMMSKGQTAVDIDYFNRYVYYVPESSKAGAATDFIPIYKLVGPRGDGGTLNEAIQDAWVIGAKCKNPQAAVDFIAWLNFTPEGRKTIDFGLYGKHYTVSGGLLTPTDKAKASGYKGASNSLYLDYVDFDNLEWQWSFQDQMAMGRQMEVIKEVAAHQGPAYPSPAGLSEILDQQLPNIKKVREEVSSKIVLGNVSVDEGMKQYADFWKSINGEQILKDLNDKM